MPPIALLIVGAGQRGAGYASYALEHPEQADVVGVAEPQEYCRRRLAEAHHIPADNVLADWKQAAARERFADAVLICTQDAMHVEPAVAFAARGYAILLEKPMAPNEADCRRIVAAMEEHGTLFAVAHVMRYTAYTQRLKRLLADGRIGELISMQHLEPVGYWHQAHSFVRGHWRNEAESSFMLLAKSCHDLDWMRHMMGRKMLRVSSFGSRSHFRSENRPPGAAARCLDCQVESSCPYSAKKIYLGRLADGRTGWPVDVVAPEPRAENLTEALRSGPYGRCVYQCDNDVVDHQVVAMEFAGGKSGVFTVTAFTEHTDRRTRIFGTRGEISGDGKTIRVFDFLSDQQETIDTAARGGSILGGHGGGDYGLMQAFVAAVAADDPSKILSGPRETLETHLSVFAAERSRREGTVVTV